MNTIPCFIKELIIRNPLLFWYGVVCAAGAAITAVLTRTSTVQVNNVSAFLKPLKFFLSVWIFCWTIGWLWAELPQKASVETYSTMVVVVMTIELSIILWQAANGRLSHYNVSKPLYASLFTLMGVAIVILTLWTLIMGLQFFGTGFEHLSPGYLWGIRLGIVFFAVFAFQGAMMGARLQHTVGAPDGNDGLPIVNWSKKHGDLRVAHFFGMHSLQLLPLAGQFLFKTPFSIIVFSFIYGAVVTLLLVRALKGLPVTNMRSAH